MESLLADILDELTRVEVVSDRRLRRLINHHNIGLRDESERFSKKKLLAFCLTCMQDDPERWRRLCPEEDVERRLLQSLRLKPRRTASGVATITVLTKPWPCSSNCLYCPNDIRMPKSYLADEPACQRAERVGFDPYLQVARRLKALVEMGHVTDKVELIVLGGTWNDYPQDYRRWFTRELFRGLNEFQLEDVKPLAEPVPVSDSLVAAQARIDAGELTYNEAWAQVYGADEAWQAQGALQTATLEELAAEQRRNETAAHRVVGLVFETRPDLITPENLLEMRRMGCTKIQMGIQSMDGATLAENHRALVPERIAQALGLARLFGFKLHVHMMLNLFGATPDTDRAEYRQLFADAGFKPDEVKLYPCVAVAGTGLQRLLDAGEWTPYPDGELISVLADDLLATPPYARVSRMIRDISASDILAGNKKGNLRQMVEQTLEDRADEVAEIRFREVARDKVDLATLRLEDYVYETTVSTEHFLQWVTDENRIAGFCRLSLPKQDVVAECSEELPIALGEAMIRELHVYGEVAALSDAAENAQHLGLGRKLLARAEQVATEAGYTALNVISAVGTREYYRKHGFSDTDNGLYQRKA